MAEELQINGWLRAYYVVVFVLISIYLFFLTSYPLLPNEQFSGVFTNVETDTTTFNWGLSWATRGASALTFLFPLILIWVQFRNIDQRRNIESLVHKNGISSAHSRDVQSHRGQIQSWRIFGIVFIIISWFMHVYILVVYVFDLSRCSAPGGIEPQWCDEQLGASWVFFGLFAVITIFHLIGGLIWIFRPWTDGSIFGFLTRLRQRDTASEPIVAQGSVTAMRYLSNPAGQHDGKYA